jgi:KamA family protein
MRSGQMNTTTELRLLQAHERTEPNHAAKCLLDINALLYLSEAELAALRPVAARFAFRANDYYLSLINWSDPADPIRRLVVPNTEEVAAYGELDASDEASNTPLAGLQHKYADTALLLVTDQCSCFCRYCFRKRLFSEDGERETARDFSAVAEYIRQHAEITDVLLTGGDALSLPGSRLEELFARLGAIPHVRSVRLGSKIPAFNPARILGDRTLQHAFRHGVASGKNIYVMCHFDHPREFTPIAFEALELLRGLGVTCLNQCPVTRGVNDDAGVLADLLQMATDAGCPQYYLFQCRPTVGNAGFSVPITRAFVLVSEARSRVSGLSRRARFCMSHASGKIEVVGLDEQHIYARYHRAKSPADDGRMLVFKRDDEAMWFDQLVPARCGEPLPA